MEFDDKYTGNLAFGSQCSDMAGIQETFGEELERVKEHNHKHPKTVWTILDVGDKLVIAAGFHYVNRFLYFISNEEWENENEEYDWE